jgi:hypothetical protein
MPSSQVVFNNTFDYVFSQNGSKPFYDGDAIFIPCTGDPGSGGTAILMYAKLDAQTPWAIQDMANSPLVAYFNSANFPPGGTIEVGDYIYAAYFKSTDRLMAISRFSKSARTWEEIATGGPTALAADNIDAASSVLNIQHYNGIFTIPFRDANETISSNPYWRTKVVRWNNGWEASQVTFASHTTGLADFCDNISTTIDSSGNVHMLADLRKGSHPSQAVVWFQLLHQICYANGTLSAVTSLEDITGNDLAFDSLGRQYTPFYAYTHASIPEFVGDKIGFGIVWGNGNTAIPTGFNGSWPGTLAYYRFDPTAPAIITPLTFEVPSAHAVLHNRDLHASTTVIPAQTRKTGLVTIEKSGSVPTKYAVVYHDITDIATNRLIIWIHYPDDILTDVDPVILYGAYFDDTGLIGTPFEIYRSTFTTSGEVIYQVMYGYGAGVAALTISVADQMVMTDSVATTVVTTAGPSGTNVSECLEIIVASAYCSTWKTADDASPMEAGCTGVYAIDTEPCT